MTLAIPSGWMCIGQSPNQKCFHIDKMLCSPQNMKLMDLYGETTGSELAATVSLTKSIGRGAGYAGTWFWGFVKWSALGWLILIVGAIVWTVDPNLPLTDPMVIANTVFIILLLALALILGFWGASRSVRRKKICLFDAMCTGDKNFQQYVAGSMSDWVTSDNMSEQNIPQKYKQSEREETSSCK